MFRWGYANPVETDKWGDASGNGQIFEGWPSQPQGERVIVDKRTHRIRFEDETENQVTIVIEPK